MKKYRVNVNGVEYEVAVEALGEGEVAAAPAPAPAAAPAPAPAAAPAAVPAGGEKIAAPMPGTILAVNVAVGDTVEKGTVLMVLEAMKMENEIMAPCSGKVTFVGVTKGQSVNTGAPLCTIE
mgnify:CR=1 FL=1